VRELAGATIKVGATTDDVDKVVHDAIVAAGAYPSPLGYCGFPRSVCTSVNNVICHGIPDTRILQDGDIVNVDVSCCRLCVSVCAVCLCCVLCFIVLSVVLLVFARDDLPCCCSPSRNNV
jgi:hypothetical protein